MKSEQKKIIKDWWTNHSQDYKEDYKSEYLGINLDDLSDNEFIKYIDDLDLVFARKAYFAQKENKLLFSNLITNQNLNNKKVLEIGCGLGSHSQVLAELGADLISIDLSEKSVQTTIRRLKLKGLKANIFTADCENLPFEDNTFDYIWSWGVIHHTPDTNRAAQEIIRVLKPNGMLDIMVYNNNSIYKLLNVYFRYGILNFKFFQGYSKQDLKNMYTDGKEIGGAPLSKYYSKNDLIKLFGGLKFLKSKAFEQKNFFTFWIPKSFKYAFEKKIPDFFYSFLFKKFGFLLFASFIKEKK